MKRFALTAIACLLLATAGPLHAEVGSAFNPAITPQTVNESNGTGLGNRDLVSGGVQQLIPGTVDTSLQVSPAQTTAGGTVYFTYSATPPTVSPPFPSITNLVLDYGDGNIDVITPGSPGLTVTGTVPHTYAQRGIYAATLRAIDSDGNLGASAAITAVTDGSMAQSRTGRGVVSPLGILGGAANRRPSGIVGVPAAAPLE
jgi:hypothetical protein